VVEDALRERGIETGELIDALNLFPRPQLARLFADYDEVWQ